MSLTMYVISSIVVITLGLVAYFGIQIKKTKKAIANYQQLVTQIKQQKAVSDAQVKNYQEKAKNEENARSADRNDLIDRLQQQGDLRD